MEGVMYKEVWVYLVFSEIASTPFTKKEVP